MARLQLEVRQRAGGGRHTLSCGNGNVRVFNVACRRGSNLRGDISNVRFERIGGFNSLIPTGDVAMVNTISGLALTADQEFEAGLTCNGVAATLTRPLPLFCPGSEFASTLVKIPAPGTENDDHNPQRIQPRSLFDLAVGQDNLFHGDRYKWSLRFTVVNLTNKVALYNFLSTFSGTHYVTPRTETAELGFHF